MEFFGMRNPANSMQMTSGSIVMAVAVAGLATSPAMTST
jgi:hypothetical protein